MFLFQFFVVAALFFLLAPGVLVTLKGSKYFIAAIHAILFTFIVSMIYMLFWMPNQHWSSLLLLRNSEEEFGGFLRSDSGEKSPNNEGRRPVRDPFGVSTLVELFEGGPVNEHKYGNCPEGQNWISGSIKRYGYCSPSTVTEIVTQSSPVASPSPAKNRGVWSQPNSKGSFATGGVCPSGQNWISGTNPKYGYCSPSAISDVLPSSSTSAASTSAAVLPKEKASSKVALVPDSCPEGQNLISGTNSNYGYCSTSSVSSLLNDPSRSSITAINPVDVRGASTFR